MGFTYEMFMSLYQVSRSTWIRFKNKHNFVILLWASCHLSQTIYLVRNAEEKVLHSFQNKLQSEWILNFLMFLGRFWWSLLVGVDWWDAVGCTQSAAEDGIGNDFLLSK